MSFQVPYDMRLAACGSKHLALYQAIRDSIVNGALPLGAKLPSTRELAALYGLSRGSVSVAYEMLAAEGYVRSAVGQGTYVAGEEARAYGGSAVRQRGLAGQTDLPAPALSSWGKRLLQQETDISRADTARKSGAERGLTAAGGGWPESGRIDDCRAECGLPDRSGSAPRKAERISFAPRGMGERWFPWMSWKSAVSSEWRCREFVRSGANELLAGSPELRLAVAGRLRRERGIVCEADDIVVTGGSMQAITLLTQMLLEPGQAAVAEEPGYYGTRRAIGATGAALIPAAVDRQGIVPGDWRARMLFVTPTRQFPTGAVLTYERRLALLEWASRRGAWIVEDDYDSEFRWGGRPIEPLKSLDSQKRVIYIGSFSRTMRQEVRIGYAVLPPALREPFLLAKQLYDPWPAGLTEQRALARWMNEGEYDRHLRRTRRIFHRLHECLREELGQLGHLFEAYPADAGLLLYARWRGSPDAYDRLVQACEQSGVSWGDGAVYAAVPKPAERTALFGFAHLDEAEIMRGAQRIRDTAAHIGLAAACGPERGGTGHA